MGRREKVRKAKSARFDYDEEEGDYENQNHNISRNSSFVFIDSDDDKEAYEDLSLKIVQKSISRASHAAAANNGGFAGTSYVTFDEDIVTTELLESKTVKKKVKKEKEKKKKKAKKTSNENQAVTMTKEEEVLETVNCEEEAKKSETTEGVDDTNSENAVLRRLLRGPRYFDPPDKSWGACFNCGEEGHSAVNCTAAKRKKPCFICGSLEHEAKQCQKGQDCFICKGGGHRAKDCPQSNDVPRTLNCV